MITVYKEWKLHKTFKDKEMRNMNDIKYIYTNLISKSLYPLREICWVHYYNYYIDYKWKLFNIKLHKYTECIYQAIMRHFWIELRSF